MPKKLMLRLLVFTSFIGSAQDTTTIDQYCRLIMSGWTTKVTIDVDMEKKVDVLNYTSIQGWPLVNTFPIGDFPVSLLFQKKTQKENAGVAVIKECRQD